MGAIVHPIDDHAPTAPRLAACRAILEGLPLRGIRDPGRGTDAMTDAPEPEENDLDAHNRLVARIDAESQDIRTAVANLINTFQQNGVLPLSISGALLDIYVEHSIRNGMTKFMECSFADMLERLPEISRMLHIRDTAGSC
jgi:hypothetical protein